MVFFEGEIRVGIVKGQRKSTLIGNKFNFC